MTKYVIAISFTVDADNLRHAAHLANSIENAAALQLDDKDLFISLLDSCLESIEELDEGDDDDDLMYENLDQNN